MLRPVILFFILAFSWAPLAWAENEGLADLDNASEAKFKAERQGDLAEVIDLCESALKKGLDKENTQFAKSLLASSLVERAMFAGKTVFAKGPVDPLWQNYRKLALADLERAVELVPNLPDARLMIARLNLLPEGDPKRAKAALDAGLAIRDTNEPEVRTQLLLLRAELEEDKAKKLVMLDEAIELSPGDAVLFRERGYLRADMGKSELAAADFAKALELNPEDASAYEAEARALADLGKFDQAMVSLDKALQLAPGSIVPLTTRAQIHAQQDNLTAALHDLNTALAMKPDNPYVLLMRAHLYYDMHRLAPALEDIDQILKRHPDLDQARRLRWAVLIDDKKLDQVATEMEEQLRKNPNDEQILLQMAMLYTADRKPQKAIAIYTSVLEKDPKNVDALEGRANALLGSGHHAEAIADYDKAMELDPEDPGTLNNLAWVLATSPDDRLRDGPRAVELATKACEVTKHEQAHILSTLAAAFAESGDFDKAIEWSKKAIELGKKDDPQDVQESLDKELKSYQQHKPWRELLSEGLDAGPVEKTAEKKTP